LLGNSKSECIRETIFKQPSYPGVKLVLWGVHNDEKYTSMSVLLLALTKTSINSIWVSWMALIASVWWSTVKLKLWTYTTWQMAQNLSNPGS